MLSVMEALPATYFRSRTCVYRKDGDGELHPYERLVADKILEAAARGDSTSSWNVEISGRPSSWFLLWNSIRKCDLQRMKLVNPGTAEEENIVIEFPWDPKSLVSIVGLSTSSPLRRQVLVMALDRLRREPSLRKVLTMKDLPTFTIRENPYLCPGHPPYENFVESLLGFFDGRSDAENLFERFLESAADEAGGYTFNALDRGGIRTVFHGTNHAVMDAILSVGMDPSRRRSNASADYFGLDYLTSLHYTETKTQPTPSFPKLLVFMIIKPPSSTFNVGHSLTGQVTVELTEFELPLAEITLHRYYDSDD